MAKNSRDERYGDFVRIAKPFISIQNLIQVSIQCFANLHWRGGGCCLRCCGGCRSCCRRLLNACWGASSHHCRGRQQWIWATRDTVASGRGRNWNSAPRRSHSIFASSLRTNFLRICANWTFSRVASDLHHLRTRLKIPRATCVCIFTNAGPTAFNTQHVTDSNCWWNSSICILEIFYLLKKIRSNMNLSPG